MHSNENFHIIESLGLIIVSHNHLLDQISVEKIINEIKSNPFFKEEYFVLIDIRRANIKMNSEDIQDLSNYVYDILKETVLKKFAILASESQMNKTVEFIRAYRESSKYQIFLSLHAALSWLSIPVERKHQVQVKLNYLETL